MIDPQANYTALQELLTQGAGFLDWPEEKLLDIHKETSGWSVGQHLYHITLANASIPKLIERLKAGTLGNTEDEPKPKMLELITEGIIPGGREAPKRVVPPEDLTAELLNRDFKRMQKATKRLEPILGELHAIPNRFPHLYFGPMSALQWLRFMEIHTRHHMVIVDKLVA